MQITGINANGASSTAAWTGGKGNFSLYGDFSGGSARVEYSFDSGTTWIAIENENMEGMSINRERGFNFELPACDIHVFMANATSAPSLTANIEAI